MKTPITQMDQVTIQTLYDAAKQTHQSYLKNSTFLDLTRGKPCSDQLDLSNGIISNTPDIITGSQDIRNYGLLTGTQEACQLGSEILQIPAEEIISFGNSSLFLMYLAVETALFFGFNNSSWTSENHSTQSIKFLCPVPGYDRHHTICESLGIEMLPIPMTPQGPDMEIAQEMTKSDPLIKGMWCIPKHSNPTGITYSEENIQQICQLTKGASDNFLVIWDNAYAVHDLYFPPEPTPNIFEIAKTHKTLNKMIFTASTSKITFAGAGIAFLGASESIRKSLIQRLSTLSINPDKVMQQKNALFLKGKLQSHMQAHAEILRPKFELALKQLDESLAKFEIADWTRPKGGYFISLNTQPHLATRVIQLAKDAQLALTPAGSTFPYKKDPLDQNIRIAPSYPNMDQLFSAMKILTTCIQLATFEKYISSNQ